jgi:hypothetical protein
MPDPDSGRPDFVPIIVLCAVLGAIGLGFWLFPYMQKMIQGQDCIAVGREDCG